MKRRFSLTTLLSVMTISGLLVGWYIDHFVLQSKLNRQAYLRPISDRQLSNGSSALSNAKQCITISDGWLLSSDSTENVQHRQNLRFELLCPLHDLYLHEDAVNRILMEYPGNSALRYAKKILVELGCQFEEQLLSIGQAVSKRGNLPPAIYQAGSAEHTQFIAFVRRALKSD